MSLKYYLPNYGESVEDAREIPRNTETDPSWFAKQAADWCHARRDGWEWSWPVIFIVVDENGSEHRFEIDREMAPEFVIL